MRRLACIAVAALLLSSGLAPAVAATSVTVPAADPTSTTAATTDASTTSTNAVGPEDDGATTAANNTTTRLQLPGSRTGNYSSVRLDFGGTMAMSAERVQSQYETSLVELQLESVESRNARVSVVNAYLDAANDELDELAAAEERAVQRYRNGEISEETLLVKLAIVDMRARAIEESFGRIRASSSSLPRSTLNRIENVRLELSGFQTSTREHVATAAAGELRGDVNPLYVTTSDVGVVVEMLDDRRYYRNAVRFDNRQPGTVDQFDTDVDQFQDRLSELYPWSYAEKSGIKIDTYSQRNLYTANYLHPQGSIVTYVDGATTDVIREQQSLILGRLPRLEPKETSVNNVTVTVSETSNGGPFHVNVTERISENATAEPVDAIVRVNGQIVGRTGPDGELWTLAPIGAYEVTVVRDETTINVSVSP